MKIYELLNSPEKWTKRTMARNSKNEKTFPRSPEACCWCLAGAFIKTYIHVPYQEYNDLLLKIEKELVLMGYSTMYQFNDAPETTYENVINLCKRLDV